MLCDDLSLNQRHDHIAAEGKGAEIQCRHKQLPQNLSFAFHVLPSRPIV